MGKSRLFFPKKEVVSSPQNGYIKGVMNKQHQQQIQQHINEAFEAINKLSDLITANDLQWADKNWEKNDFAAELTNLAENLIDSGKQFYLYDDED